MGGRRFENLIRACPFCGCQPRIYTGSKGGLPSSRISCVCGVDGPEFEIELTEEERDASAIREWNKRTAGWISVKARLPEEQDMVLVYCSDEEDAEDKRGFIAIDHLARDRFTDGTPLVWYCAGDIVTHWMDLPEEPKKGVK